MLRFGVVVWMVLFFVSCQTEVCSGDYSISEKDKARVAEIADSLRIIPKHDIQSRIKLVAHFLMDAPYVPHTLDDDSVERVVLNVHGFDCVTFVETVLALANMDDTCTDPVQCYGENTEALRYRKGRCDGVLSRLHYFSEWLSENRSNKRLVEIELGDLAQSYSPKVSYMSNHPEMYRWMKDKQPVIDSIRAIEENIRTLNFKYVPQSEIFKLNAKVQDGDVIAILTNIKGLDITHTGFAFFHNENLHFLHASSQQGKVLISESQLHDYVNSIGHMTGIIVYRPLPF